MAEQDPNEKVRVSIRWTETTEYHQYKTMSRADFESLSKRAFNGRRDAEDIIDGKLSLSRDNWQDSRDHSIEEFEIEPEEETAEDA